MKKIILGALCVNLLYTNANLMAAASEGVARWAFALMIGFALTYSLISTYALFHVQQIFPIAVFAVLDGFAVYTHLAPHGENFKMLVAAYFGIYTAYTLLIIYATRDGKAESGSGSTVDGHDAAYWHKCFLYQKSRAEVAQYCETKSRADNDANGNKMTPFKNAEQTPDQFRETTKMIDGAHQVADGSNLINDDKVILDAISEYKLDVSNQILSIKRAFARMKDPDKRRERIKSMPPEVQAEIRKIYEL